MVIANSIRGLLKMDLSVINILVARLVHCKSLEFPSAKADHQRMVIESPVCRFSRTGSTSQVWYKTKIFFAGGRII